MARHHATINSIRELPAVELALANLGLPGSSTSLPPSRGQSVDASDSGGSTHDVAFQAPMRLELVGNWANHLGDRLQINGGRVVLQSQQQSPHPMRLPRRFDSTLMRAPDARGAVDAALLVALRAWCEGGAFPVMTEPLRVASIAPRPDLDAAACVLDGGHELARLGRWRGLLWRLQILWREHVAGHHARPGDPWDCGWWREGPMGPADAFRPRRATLLMLREPAPAVAAALLALLRERSPAYARPLRLMVVSAAPVAGMTRLEIESVQSTVL